MGDVVRLPMVRRPRVRSECEASGFNAARPCRFSSCEWNSATLYRAPPGTCILDVAEEPRTLEQVGAVLAVSRERIRQIEWKALRKLRARGVKIGALWALRHHTFQYAQHPLETKGEEI